MGLLGEVTKGTMDELKDAMQGVLQQLQQVRLMASTGLDDLNVKVHSDFGRLQKLMSELSSEVHRVSARVSGPVSVARGVGPSRPVGGKDGEDEEGDELQFLDEVLPLPGVGMQVALSGLSAHIMKGRMWTVRAVGESLAEEVKYASW